MDVELISLAYSPWSEKARWALDHHRVNYRVRRYQPLIGELPLRVRLGDWTGPISVPVMRAGGEWVRGSSAIARWAEECGRGAPLFGGRVNSELEGMIDELDVLSEEALDAGRALGLPRFITDDEFLAVMVPPGIPRALGRPLARLGIRRTLRKYGAHARAREDHEARLTRVLDRARAALAGQTQKFLLGEFTFADIAVAQVLQFVEPANLGGFRMREAGRTAYRNSEIADSYADVVAWRDWLYETRREPDPSS